MTELQIGLFNANGLVASAIDDILSYCQQLQILFITETWLLPPTTLPTTWIQHHTYGKPVAGNFRGSAGLSLLIHPSFPYTVNIIPSPSPYLLLAKIGNLNLACTYLPPSLSITECTDTLAAIPTTHNTIICGDFNARMGELTGDKIWTPRGRSLRNWFDRQQLTLLNPSMAYGIPTFLSQRQSTILSSIVDFFLCTGPLPEAKMQVWTEHSLSSDHKLVQLSFQFDYTGASPPPDPVRRMWNLSRLQENDVEQLYVTRFEENAEALKNTLQLLLDDEATERPPIDELTEQLNQYIYEALDLALGTKPARPKHWKWFWTRELEQMAKQRERCYQQWRRSIGINRGLKWELLQQAVLRLRRAIKASRQQAFRNFCTSLENNFSKATKVIKQMRRRRQTSASFSHPHGPQRAVEVLAEHLSSAYSGHLLPAHRIIADRPQPPFRLDNCPFDVQSVTAAIRELPRRKAPGPDHLRSEMLRPIAEPLAQVITPLYQICWRWGYVPLLWRSAQVCAIYKKGDRTLPSNYRPNSLTSILRKAMEHCLAPILHQQSPPIELAQGGFRVRRSALDQALCLHEMIQIHRQRHGIDPVLAFLDIKAAYDTVDRDIIWQRLIDYASPAPLISLLQNMFDEVSISVVANNYVSPTFTTETGVLQGSVLSPHLYSLYIDTLPKALRSAASRQTIRLGRPNTAINALLFADDVALIGTADEVKTMLQIAERHSTSTGYRWSPSKCAIIQGGDHQFSLYQENVPQLDHFVYLGVPFRSFGLDQKLLLSLRTPKAIADMILLKHIGVKTSGLGPLLSAKLYRQFVRPKLEYGLAISKFLATQVADLEKAQNQCLRLIMHGHPTSSTMVFKHLTDLPDMRTRVLTLAAKYVIRAEKLPPDSLFSLLQPRLKNRRSRWRYMQTRNPLFVQWNSDRTTKLSECVHNMRYQQHLHLCTNKALLAACRSDLGIDPILTLPATRKERSRLLRWRLGWLPGRPQACDCGQHRTTKTLFSDCPLIPTNPWNDLPPVPLAYQGSSIDFALNQLPCTATKSGVQISRAQTTWWPVLLELLQHIDRLCHPDALFPAEPPPDQIFQPPNTRR